MGLSKKHKSRGQKKSEPKTGTINAGAKVKKLNPFELKFNRSKHNVLGQKKGSVAGAPGASRKRAFEQREKTLGVERERVGKVSKIIDKRLGEKLGGDEKTEEEKQFMRFAAEKSKHVKANKFALEDDNEEIVLTHRGQALSEIQKFDRGEMSDDDEAPGGSLGADIVRIAHFGGGEPIRQDGEAISTQKLSRKELLNEIVAKSRKAKLDRQQTKDEMEARTESLDEKFKALQEKLQKSQKPPGAAKEQKPEPDDFDRLASLLKKEEDSREATANEQKNPILQSTSNLPAEQVKSLKEKEKERLSSLGIDTSVPFVFKMPKNYEQFVDLIGKHPETATGEILTRLTTCYHPSLKEGNKNRLKRLFVFLLRHYDIQSRKAPTKTGLKQLQVLAEHIHLLMKLDIEHAVECVRNMLTSNWTRNKKKTNVFHVVSLLRLSTSLFPTTQSFHPVSSPALQMAVHFLARARINDLHKFAQFTLLATALLDYVKEGKQYVPELIGFLYFSLDQAVPKQPDALPLTMQFAQLDFLGPMSSRVQNVKSLKLEEVFAASEEKQFTDSPSNRFAVLHALLQLIERLRLLYLVHTHSYKAIFRPILSTLRTISTRADLPVLIQEEVKKLIENLEEAMTQRVGDFELRQLSRAKTETSMLKMLEPRIEENFNPERPRTNRDPARKGAAAEQRKLEHLVKSERKGAIKELRKDTKYLANKQLSTIKAKDRERRIKTKRILGGLAEQQGEWNKEKREKK